MTAAEEAFLQQILQERDRLFRETSKLKSQLANYENFESERASYEQQIDQKDVTIARLKQQVEMLQRKIWGKSSERYVNGDPQQRRIDFEGLDLLPEEKELATSAKEEIVQYKTIRVPVKEKPTQYANPCRKASQGKNATFTLIFPDWTSGPNWNQRSPKYWNATRPDGLCARSSATNMC